MKTNKANGKLVIRIHQVLIGVLLLSYVFLYEPLKKVSLIVLAAAVLSLFIQALMYGAKPEWYGDKIKKHPHEV